MKSVIVLGGHVLYEAGTVPSVQEGLDMLNATLHDGTAVERFAAMIKAQGVQPELADKLCVRFADVMSILPKSKYNTEIKCPYSGNCLCYLNLNIRGGSICHVNAFITPSTNSLGFYSICQTKHQSLTFQMAHKPLSCLSNLFSYRLLKTHTYIRCI